MSERDDFDALERRLAAADFSADSRVREELRARLLRRRTSPWPRPAVLRAAVLAAGLLAVLVPALRWARPGAPEELAAYPRGAEGLPVLPGRFLSGASAAAAAPVFEVVRGREIDLVDGKAVQWDFEGASFRLETRRVDPGEFFEKPRLRGVL